MIGVAPDFLPAYDVRFSTTAIGMVAVGLGVTVLPKNSMELTAAAGVRNVALTDPVITRNICVMQHKWRSLSPPAERLKEIILAAFSEIAPSGLQSAGQGLPLAPRFASPAGRVSPARRSASLSVCNGIACAEKETVMRQLLCF